MPLDYHVDRTVKLSDTSKLKGLYDWSIQEFEGETQKGPDYIPWGWTLTFTATQITYRQQYGIGERYWFTLRRKKQVEADSDPRGFVEQEHIRIELRPGYVQDDPRWATGLSMFGANRPIEDISVFIYMVENETDEEKCIAYGGLSYTTEIDFRDETPPDNLHFYATVSRERFDQIKARVKANDFDFVTVAVNGVRGFYSEWSPGISTDSIKVLTKPEDHKLVVPAGTKIDPPVLKDLDQFDLNFITERKSQLPIFKPDDDDDGGYDVAVDPAEHDRQRVDGVLKAVSGLEQTAKKAQVVLWIIAALLLLTLFK